MKYRYDEFNHNAYESHQLAINFVPTGAKVLDVGCATGYMARELQKKDCETYGVDYDKKAVTKAGAFCKKTAVVDIDHDSKLPFSKKSFDYVLLTDVIEHLTHPENAFRLAKTYLKDGGKAVISVPNIAHASIRWSLLNGNFQYTTTGIMDQTHVHFYTKKSLIDTLEKAGLKILKIVPTNGMCKVPFLYKITDRLPKSLQYKIVCWQPALFAYQFVALVQAN